MLWHRSKGNRDYLDLETIFSNEEFKRAKVVLLNSNYGNETFLIINPKVPVQLETFLLEKLKTVLGNISSCEFSVSDLKEEIMTDALTQVSSVEKYQNLINTKKEIQNVGVCFLDVNGLGVVNNLYGHDEGDKMLITIANAIKKYVRKTDVYRKGGDEFIIVCEDVTEERFLKRMETIREEILQTGYSASFGIVYRNFTNDLEDLVNLADSLMYVEKEQYRRENPDKYSISR